MSDDKTYVPYIVYEGEMARQERHIKRLLATLITILVFFFASNMAWLYVWNQYDYIDQTKTIEIDADQDGEGINVVGGEDVNYGPDGNDRNSQEKTQTEEEKR